MAVQGPPGTGKTHTIANIICHYLANGKKILVTSKGEKALEMQEKVPEEVRPLTVALLSGDRHGMQQFQASIEAIIHHVSQMNPDVVASQIKANLSDIDRAHEAMQRIDRRIDEIAMTQLSDIEVDGVRMRAQKMYSPFSPVSLFSLSQVGLQIQLLVRSGENLHSLRT